MNVTIIGSGYVGLTTGVALAYLGHKVTGVDVDTVKLEMLHRGVVPIHEPGLEELMAQAANNLTFTNNTTEAVAESDLIMIAVGTPQKQNGEANTVYVEAAVREVAMGLLPGRSYTVVIKSTVPIGTNRRVAHVIKRVLGERNVVTNIHQASNPEFLREGMALKDTLYPDRIVVGAESEEAIEAVRRLYRPIMEQTFESPSGIARPEGFPLPPMVTTDATSAEMIKYASNAFLAVKISFINEIAGLCDRVGADVTEVARGMGLDTRIGPRFLAAGLGWGGSCFPKDTAAILAVGTEYGYEMPVVQSARDINDRQRQTVIEKLQAALKVLRGRTIGVLGLAFKPDTDDVRESPAIELIRLLVERGAHVKAHDPVAITNASQVLTGLEVEFTQDPYQTAVDADALILATEWQPYYALDLVRIAGDMRTPVLVDGRNIICPQEAARAGFTYIGVGR